MQAMPLPLSDWQTQPVSPRRQQANSCAVFIGRTVKIASSKIPIAQSLPISFKKSVIFNIPTQVPPFSSVTQISR